MQETTETGRRKPVVPIRKVLRKKFSENGAGHYATIPLPKEFLQASKPGPSGTGDFSYDVCFIRASFKHDINDSPYDELSPLLGHEGKQGFADDNQTFPKHIYLTDTPFDPAESSAGTVESWLPNSAESSNVNSNPTLETTLDSYNAQKKTVGLKKMTQILCLVALLLVAVIMACGIFYIFSTCPAPTQTTNRNQDCSSKYHFLSSCSFTCKPGFVLKGTPNVKCGIDRHWSEPIPVCECPPCYTGPHCEYSIDWIKLEGAVSKTLPGIYKTIHYGNRSLQCVGQLNWEFRWRCECYDLPTRKSIKCNNFQSLSGSCIHTLANLVNKMVKAGVYAPPCNAEVMKKSLNCSP